MFSVDRDGIGHTQYRGGSLDGFIFALVEIGNEEVESRRVLFWEMDRLGARLAKLPAEGLFEVLML